MKHLPLILALLVCTYLYLHPRVETRVELAPVVDSLPAATPPPAPAPTPEPKLYYHSALDGPTATNVVASGYFSTDPSSTTGQHLSNPPAYAPSYYPYYYGSGTVYNTVIINGQNRSSTGPNTYRYPTPVPARFAVPAPRFVPPPSTVVRRTVSQGN